MAAMKREKTKYPGVFYRTAERIGGAGVEKIYYIVFKKEGKVLEEKVGRQFADDMTPARASTIRSERIEGKRDSRKEIREKEQAAIKALREQVTIEFVWNHFQNQYETKKSLRDYWYLFKNHLIVFATKSPDEIFTADIVAFRKSLEAKKLSPASVRHTLALLRRLIRYGVKEGLCSNFDPSRLHFEMPKLDNEKTEILTREQIISFEKALEEEADQNAAAFMRLALATGMRKGALMGLRWDDIDFEHGIITLRGEFAKKGKTERIPLSATARAILLSVDKMGSPYVFPGKDGGPRKEFRRVARRVKKKAGLPDDFRPLHGLRHTYASYLASSGKVDLYTLQKLLTHSSPEMTQRYAHLADDAMQRAASVADEVLKVEVLNDDKARN